MKLNFKLIVILFGLNFSISNTIAASINIDTIIDNKIITNFEISKEARYLKILNPNLNNLSEEQIYNLARQSLIKEIIKRNEITKFINLENENLVIDEYYLNLIMRLGYESKKKFEEALKFNKSYSVEEIKTKIKIEFYWNELIFNRFSNQINIDENELRKKINSLTNENKKTYLLSEIVFKKQKDEDINDTITKIKKAISEIGFGNTANLYSISDSAKFAGRVGWIAEGVLSEKINKEIKLLKIDQISKPIEMSNSFIILKIEDIKISKNEINKEKELKKLSEIERNKKLEKFSRIYFNKIKKNYSINEK